MNLTPEQLTDELANRAKGRPAKFNIPMEAGTRELLNLIKRLDQIPKTVIPMANFERVRNQILDRIAIPQEQAVTSNLGMFMAILPRFAKIGGTILGVLVVLISGTIGVSALAIQSVPGQPIYPVKKVVENVQLKLASTEAEKTNLQIKFANNRLEELEKVLEQGQQGKVSDATVQKVVENTVNNVSKTATSVSGKSTDQSQTTVLTKLVDLSNKQTALLESASIKSEGEVKIEIDKALETAKDSHDQTIENIEKAGLIVEDNPISISDKPDNNVEANGKITAVTSTSISIGTSKFLLTKDTKFVNIKQEDLKVGVAIEITGQVIQTNTYAVEITAKTTTTESPDAKPTVEPPPPADSSK